MTSPSSDPQATPDRPAVDPPDTQTAAGSRPAWAVNARHAILAAVVDRPAATTTDLTASTGYSRPAVHRALLELETAGLLRREPGASGGPGSRRRGSDRWYPTGSAADLADPAALAAAANPSRRPATTGRGTTPRPAPHRLLTGLLDVLPTPGTPLPPDHRRRWLAAADFALTLLYPDPPDEPVGDSGRPPGATGPAAPHPG